jgi:hypothetical protein
MKITIIVEDRNGGVLIDAQTEPPLDIHTKSTPACEVALKLLELCKADPRFIGGAPTPVQ